MSKRHRVASQLGILRDLGCRLSPGTTILDLGCGNGCLVGEYRQEGYQAYGCDLKFKDGPFTDDFQKKEIIRLISLSPYRLPFDDGTFDVIVSDQVIEHVKDYAGTLSEIRRVMRPNGVSLHVFPSRYTPIEPHTSVPYGTIIQSYPWLLFWAHIGIRNKSQKSLSAKETAERNYHYLRNHTHYVSKAVLRRHFESTFSEVHFCEQLFLKYSRRAKILHPLSRIIPFIPDLYGLVRDRAVFLKNGKPSTTPDA